MTNDKPTSDTMNTLDQEGFTPFLRYIQTFTTSYSSYLDMIIRRMNIIFITMQTSGQKAEYSDYKDKITNATLFDPNFDNSSYYANNSANSDYEERMNWAKEIVEKIIVSPFIEVLKQLTNEGADSSA